MDDYTNAQRVALVESCPKEVFELEDYNTNTNSATSRPNQVLLVRPTECIFCRECLYLLEEYRKNPEDNLGVEIKHSNTKFTFTVETTGALLAKEVVRDSLSILALKINSIYKGVSEIQENGSI